MVKDNETVIQSVLPQLIQHLPTDKASREWNDIVNMSAKELKDWLQQEESEDAGWSKDDGSGETVGHERYRSQQLRQIRR